MRIAFFDMDKTLLSASSGWLYTRFLWRRKLITLGEMLGVIVISAQYAFNLLNFPQAMARLGRRVRGGDAEAIRQLCEECVAQDILPRLAPRAVQRLRAHQAAGDYVVLLSASTQFIVAPVARHLGIDYCCTELEVRDGRLTGQLADKPCYGAGKLHWARRIAEPMGIALHDCTFYTDSYSDLPLLEAVGTPVAVNPDAKLRRHALRCGWRIEQFY